MSPFEHCARAMTDLEYYSFIKGTIPTQIDEYGITNLEMMPFFIRSPYSWIYRVKPYEW